MPAHYRCTVMLRRYSLLALVQLMRTTLRDSYRHLQLKQGASADEVHAAFRKLSKRAHPDAGGSTERFEALAKARDSVLTALSDEPLVGPTASQPKAPPSTQEHHEPETGPMSLLTPATIAAFPIAIVGGLIGLVQVNRNIIVGSFFTAWLIFVVATTATGLVRRHRSTIASNETYLSAEEVIRLRAEALRTNRR